MAKKTHGKKIHDNQAIEKKVVEWCILEPSISDYEISKRLLKEHNFKAEQPTVASWRKNYLPSLLDSQVGVFSQSEVSKRIDMKLDSIATLTVFIDKFKDRVDELEKVLPKYNAVDRKEEGAEKADKVVYLGNTELDVEEQYQSASKFVIDLIKERERQIGGLSGYEIAQEVGEKILDLFVTYYKPDEQSKTFIEFKQALVELDTNLKERYNVNRKTK